MDLEAFSKDPQTICMDAAPYDPRLICAFDIERGCIVRVSFGPHSEPSSDPIFFQAKPMAVSYDPQGICMGMGALS